MTVSIYNNIRRNLFRWVETDRSGHSEPAGHELLTVRVEIDMAALAERLGKQAAGNKSGVSKFLGGLVVVRVTDRTRAS